MQTKTRTFLESVAILIGTIVGVGTFGIPYAFARAGAGVGLAYLVVLTGIVLLLYLLYGEVVLRTSERHRLVGYATTYLGRWGRIGASIVSLGVIGSLLTYTIMGGNFLAVLAGPSSGLTTGHWSLLFTAAMAFFLLTDFRTGAPAELALNVAKFAIFAVIIVVALPDGSFANLAAVPEAPDYFLPYGVLFFALSGSSAIPELREVLWGDKGVRRVIVWGTLLPALLYAAFGLSVVSVLGQGTTPNAIAGLAERYGDWMRFAGGTVGLLAVSSAFIVLGLVTKHVLTLDFKFPRAAATLAVVGAPLLLFLLVTHDTLRVMGFIGSVLGGIEGMLMLAIHRAARRHPGSLAPPYALHIPLFAYWALGALFVAGIAYEVFYTLLA